MFGVFYTLFLILFEVDKFWVTNLSSCEDSCDLKDDQPGPVAIHDDVDEDSKRKLSDQSHV